MHNLFRLIENALKIAIFLSSFFGQESIQCWQDFSQKNKKITDDL